MRNNPEKTAREYYCKFSDGGNLNSIIKRAWITRNSYIRPPVLYNDTGKRKICCFYDPARSSDNSILLIAELREDPENGYMMDILNCISFADLALKRRTPMMYQDQIREIHNILLDYNGDALDYDNIEVFMADAGSGGGGNSWVADSLIEDWTDNNGNTHCGLIDKQYSSEYVKRFPNAVNKMRLINPGTYKSEAFEALIKMTEANLITFPAEYDNKGYLNILEVDESTMAKAKKEIMDRLDKMNLPKVEYDEMLADELSKIDIGKVKVKKLNFDEEVALKQIDMMKEEIVNICRTKRDSGKDSFKLPPYKDADTGASEATMHDDRAYCLALLGLYLQEKRLSNIRSRKKQDTYNIIDMLPIRQGKQVEKIFG